MLHLIALFCGQRSEARSDPPNVFTSEPGRQKSESTSTQLHVVRRIHWPLSHLIGFLHRNEQKRGNAAYPPLPKTHKEKENKIPNGLSPAGPLWIYLNNSNTDITAPVITLASSNTLSYARNHSSPLVHELSKLIHRK